jgi:ADP-ribose pyrophosphatase YjhB (NUDIX family)
MAHFEKIADRYNPTNFATSRGYPDRLLLEDSQTDWTIDLAGYMPENYTDPEVLNNPLADHPAPNPDLIRGRLMPGDGVQFNDLGYPICPIGRTGIEGRGLLYRFGANYLSLLALISGNTVLVIERTDNGNLALPGGYVEAGETFVEAATREAREEIIPGHSFRDARQVGKFIVLPDSKITDNAWITAGIVVDIIDRVEDVKLRPNLNEVRRAEWMDISEAQGRMFPAHQFLLSVVMKELGMEGQYV